MVASALERYMVNSLVNKVVMVDGVVSGGSVLGTAFTERCLVVTTF